MYSFNEYFMIQECSNTTVLTAKVNTVASTAKNLGVLKLHQTDHERGKKKNANNKHIAGPYSLCR